MVDGKVLRWSWGTSELPRRQLRLQKEEPVGMASGREAGVGSGSCHPALTDLVAGCVHKLLRQQETGHGESQELVGFKVPVGWCGEGEGLGCGSP